MQPALVFAPQTLEILSSDHLNALDNALERLDVSEKLAMQGYLNQYLGKVLHNSIIRLLRDVITTFKQG